MIQITQVLAKDNDLLEVHGFDDSDPTTELVANGWQSAMTNFPDESSGERLYREMIDAEKQVYWTSLLQEQLPVVAQTQTTDTVLFTNPQAMTQLAQAQSDTIVNATINTNI